MELTSVAFGAGQPVPRRHSCGGEDLSPALEWTGVPADAVSLALIVDDPDAPVGTFTHWLAWGISPQEGGIAEGRREPREGRNDFREVGYRGPLLGPSLLGLEHRLPARTSSTTSTWSTRASFQA